MSNESLLFCWVAEPRPFGLEGCLAVSLLLVVRRATMGACLQFWKTETPLVRRSEDPRASHDGRVVPGVAHASPPSRPSSVTLPSPHLEVVTNDFGEAFVYCRPCRLFLFSCEDYTDELGREHIHCKRHRRNVRRGAGQVAG